MNHAELKPQTPTPKPQTPNPKPRTLHPEPQTSNPVDLTHNPQTELNPKPETQQEKGVEKLVDIVCDNPSFIDPKSTLTHEPC